MDATAEDSATWASTLLVEYTVEKMSIHAVIFDLGGVVFESPLAFIREYEIRHGLSEQFVARVVGSGGAQGAWQRLERGELSLSEFCAQFDAEARAAGEPLNTAHLMSEIRDRSVVRPPMLDAVRTLRRARLKVAALTNNWETHEDHDERMKLLRGEFDVFVESCKVGMRKPDPRIYTLTCERLQIPPSAAVFLDDIGANLKAAKALGMKTLKVGDPATALAELGQIVGLPLR